MRSRTRSSLRGSGSGARRAEESAVKGSHGDVHFDFHVLGDLHFDSILVTPAADLVLEDFVGAPGARHAQSPSPHQSWAFRTSAPAQIFGVVVEVRNAQAVSLAEGIESNAAGLNHDEQGSI
jgi:hypothetical protein